MNRQTKVVTKKIQFSTTHLSATIFHLAAYHLHSIFCAQYFCYYVNNTSNHNSYGNSSSTPCINAQPILRDKITCWNDLSLICIHLSEKFSPPFFKLISHILCFHLCILPSCIICVCVIVHVNVNNVKVYFNYTLCTKSNKTINDWQIEDIIVLLNQKFCAQIKSRLEWYFFVVDVFDIKGHKSFKWNYI